MESEKGILLVDQRRKPNKKKKKSNEAVNHLPSAINSTVLSNSKTKAQRTVDHLRVAIPANQPDSAPSFEKTSQASPPEVEVFESLRDAFVASLAQKAPNTLTKEEQVFLANQQKLPEQTTKLFDWTKMVADLNQRSPQKPTQEKRQGARASPRRRDTLKRLEAQVESELTQWLSPTITPEQDKEEKERDKVAPRHTSSKSPYRKRGLFSFETETKDRVQLDATRIVSDEEEDDEKVDVLNLPTESQQVQEQLKLMSPRREMFFDVMKLDEPKEEVASSVKAAQPKRRRPSLIPSEAEMRAFLQVEDEEEMDIQPAIIEDESLFFGDELQDYLTVYEDKTKKLNNKKKKHVKKSLGAQKPATAALSDYIQASRKAGVYPEPIVVFKNEKMYKKGILDLSWQGLGDVKLAETASQVLASLPIKCLKVAGNRLTDRGGADLVKRMQLQDQPDALLDMSRNNLGILTVGTIASQILQNPSCSIVDLSLSHAKLDARCIQTLANALSENQTLRRLDISYNAIGVAGATHLSKCLRVNSCLQYLELGWTNILRAGAAAIIQGILENKENKLLSLDISNNALGTASASSKQAESLMDLLCTWLEFDHSFSVEDEGRNRNWHPSSAPRRRTSLLTSAGHKGLKARRLSSPTQREDDEGFSLTHLNLSHNLLGKADTEQLAQALKKNRSLIGLHYVGNCGRVDSLGNLEPTDYLVESNGDDPSTEFCELIGRLKQKQCSLELARKAVARGWSPSACCWICAGWVLRKFSLCAPKKASVRLHTCFDHPSWSGTVMLSSEQYSEDEAESAKMAKIMARSADLDVLDLTEYIVNRVCPPGEVSFFFTVDGEPVLSDMELQVSWRHLAAKSYADPPSVLLRTLKLHPSDHVENGPEGLVEEEVSKENLEFDVAESFLQADLSNIDTDLGVVQEEEQQKEEQGQQGKREGEQHEESEQDQESTPRQPDITEQDDNEETEQANVRDDNNDYTKGQNNDNGKHGEEEGAEESTLDLQIGEDPIDLVTLNVAVLVPRQLVRKTSAQTAQEKRARQRREVKQLQGTSNWALRQESGWYNHQQIHNLQRSMDVNGKYMDDDGSFWDFYKIMSKSEERVFVFHDTCEPRSQTLEPPPLVDEELLASTKQPAMSPQATCTLNENSSFNDKTEAQKPKSAVERRLLELLEEQVSNAKLQSVFEGDWRASEMELIIGSKQERRKTRSLLENHFGLLTDIFKYYATLDPIEDEPKAVFQLDVEAFKTFCLDIQLDLNPGENQDKNTEQLLLALFAQSIQSQARRRAMLTDKIQVGTSSSSSSSSSTTTTSSSTGMPAISSHAISQLPPTKLTPADRLSRPKFLELLIRIAVAKYSEKEPRESENLRALLDSFILPRARLFDTVGFCTNRVYHQCMQSLLSRNLPLLLKTYSKFSGEYSDVIETPWMSFPEWLKVLRRSELLLNDGEKPNRIGNRHLPTRQMTLRQYVERDDRSDEVAVVKLSLRQAALIFTTAISISSQDEPKVAKFYKMSFIEFLVALSFVSVCIQDTQNIEHFETRGADNHSSTSGPRQVPKEPFKSLGAINHELFRSVRLILRRSFCLTASEVVASDYVTEK